MTDLVYYAASFFPRLRGNCLSVPIQALHKATSAEGGAFLPARVRRADGRPVTSKGAMQMAPVGGWFLLFPKPPDGKGGARSAFPRPVLCVPYWTLAAADFPRSLTPVKIGAGVAPPSYRCA